MTSAKRAKKPATPKPITPVDPGPLAPTETAAGYPVDPIRAAAIGVQILRAGKLASWDELSKNDAVRARVQLTAEQRTCLEIATPILGWLSLTPKRLPYRCDTCGSIAFFGSGNPPSKCVLRLGCSGKPIRTPLTVRKAAAGS